MWSSAFDRRFAIWYGFLFALVLVQILLPCPVEWVYGLSKALIIPSLAFYYWRKTGLKEVAFLFFAALVFCWAGDMFLFVEDVTARLSFFLAGLGSFLVAQLCYAAYFFREIRKTGDGLQFNWGQNGMILLYPVIIFLIIRPGLGGFLIPVILYIVAIMLMLLAALHREGAVSKKSYAWVAIGACLFLLSDSIIAIDLFRFSFDIAPVLIMGTYMAAQYMIARGVVLDGEWRMENLVDN